MNTERKDSATRVLLISPTARDAELTSAVLDRAGIQCSICSDQEQLSEQLIAGAGAVLIAEEAVQRRGGGLVEWIHRQESWSDLPVLVLAKSGAESVGVAQAMEQLGNVTILERPTRVAALVSAVRTALRSRQRQYQIRDLLLQREQSAGQLSMAMAAANAGSWQLNLSTGEFSASDRAIELHGLAIGETLTSARARACVHPDDRASVDASLQLTVESGQPFRHEHRVSHPDGSIRWVSSHAERRLVGGHTCIIGHVQDVTERRETERRLQESEERLRLALRDTGILIYTADADLRYTWLLNPHRGYGAEDVIGRRDEDLVPAEQAAPLTAIKRRVLETGVGETGEIQLEINGLRQSYSIAVEPLRDETLAIVGVTAAAMDVTTAKEAEASLQASEHRLRLTLEASSTGLWEWDVATNLVSWSPECYRIHRMQEGEFDGTADAFDRLLHPEDRSRVWASVLDAVDRRTKYECEFRIVCPDGVVRWVANVGRATYDADKPVTMVGTLTDITDRKLVEAEWRDSEHRVRLATDATGVGIWAWNVVTGDIHWDDQMFHIYGLPQTSARIVRYETWQGAVLPEDLPGQEAQLQEAIRTNTSRTREFRIRRASDGACRIVRSVETLRSNDQGQLEWMLGTNLDITDVKRAEDALRDSEARLGGILRRSPAGIVQTDDAGCMTLLNPRWCEMLGHTEAEMLGRSILEITHPSSVAPTAAAFGRLAAGGPDFSIEKAYCRKDGSVLHAQCNVAALRGQAGEFLGMIAVVLDISERLSAEGELRRLASELAEADRRKDVFLATLAHELRNPLGPLSNGVQLMKGLPSDSDAGERVRAMMERQLSQMVRLVDDLLDVSRITQGKLELRLARLDLMSVIDAAVETSRPAIVSAGHELSIIAPERRIFVDGDSTRLAQVVSNLLNNSAKYTHRGGHIQLTVAREQGGAMIAVKDDGIGIPPAIIGRVFEMFTQADRTLEKRAGGLGIGLSLVKELVEMHGGTIEATSDGEGLGSEFVVRLPLAMSDVEPADVAPAQTDDVTPPARRRILVVDDNVDSADSIGQLLTMLGNEVHTANDGEAAVAMAAQVRPDMVLMDIGMPKLNGYEAARRMRDEAWGVNIVLVALTGWGHDDARETSAQAGFDHHIVKPVDMSVLSRLLAESRTATA